MKEKTHKYLEAFFYSEGKPQPVYIYIFIFMTLIIALVIMKMCGVAYLSDELVLGMCGFVAIWAGIVTAGKRGIKSRTMETTLDYIKEKMDGVQP
jgi:cadmium resistance protein CadD (predicted permease)